MQNRFIGRLMAGASLVLMAACATPAAMDSAAPVASEPTTQASNPIILDRFTADPAPLVVGDTLYLYVGHDDADDEQMFNIVDWRVYSTKDMKTWTDHGPIMKPTDFKWAIRDAWASEVVEKDGRFWFYTAVEHDETDFGKAIGVAVSDSPTGPFVDARGTALVTNSMTEGPHWWDDIDPTAFIDDDGTAWLLWGNANCYIAKLKDNMIELDSEIGIVDLPFFVEGPWLFKREGIYYLLYAGIDEAESGNEQIYYAMSDTVDGPYEFKGKIMGEAYRSFTIHPGVEYFNGNWYFFYHNSALDIGEREGKLGRRSVRAEHMRFNADGTIVPMVATDEGVSVPPSPLSFNDLDSRQPVWVSDQGDGTFRNPPLNADYPDPSIIRVDDTFYFATTTFVNTPGLTILQSKDLVNWEFATRVIDRLEGSPAYDMEDATAYRNGVYAPSLRYHDGVFYLAVTPNGLNTRIYRATDIAGPWTYTDMGKNWFDPALFFEADGTGYMFAATLATPEVTMLTLSDDYTAVVKEEVIFMHEGAEGSKVIRRGDWYYMFNAVPRRLGLTVSRAKDLRGPWETRDQIDSATSGGHQGALVQLADGSWYGFVMQDVGNIGRITNISPVYWEGDWPVWGTPDAPMMVPASAQKPVQGQNVTLLPSGSDFNDDALGMAFQWNHNPDDTRWSLTERPGFLRLKATAADSLWTARNTLTTKGLGPWSEGIVRLDVSGLAPGDRCGFGVLGKHSAQLGVIAGEGSTYVALSTLEDTREGLMLDPAQDFGTLTGQILYVSVQMDFEADLATLAFSENGYNWTVAADDFPLRYDWATGTFQGPQYALSCFNPDGNSIGALDVDWLRVVGREGNA